MSLLEVNDLHTQFTTRGGIVRAVDGVSFKVERGETLGLVGESGCGKSVTALSILRLLPRPTGAISKGSINFDGRDVLRMDERELSRYRGGQVGMIFQDPMTSLNPVVTVGKQIGESLKLHLGMTRRQARTRVIELLQLVNIPSPRDRLDSFPHQFSGGMRQRVMIAMALSCHPRLVIADEPTTALDVTIQAQILDLLRHLTKEFETAFLLITHDLGVVAGMADRIHVMYAGRIVEHAGTDSLFRTPSHPYTWGLLRSVPRLDDVARSRLVPIQGAPPDLISPPPACRFEPRCDYRQRVCGSREPELMTPPAADVGHVTRCWGMQHVAEGGWLLRGRPDGFQTAPGRGVSDQ